MNCKYERIKLEIQSGNVQLPNIPTYLSENLKHTPFYWQEEALQYFLLEEERRNKNEPTHLMFNMATGSGKTLLMAATILYYFKQGYNFFLFFVNRNNIVDKTENNLIEKDHSKYLFTEKIVIENETVDIRKVDAFSDNPQGIEIKFTSIQALYNEIHSQRENQITLSDLHHKDIVMLADEAHHLNTETLKTKKMPVLPISRKMTNRGGKKEIERRGWEHTVIQLILHKNGRNGNAQSKQKSRNVLLEFTATIPTTKSIAKKYRDKIIYQIKLRTFLQTGYTKEINLISSTLDKKERSLHALFLQWYRHKIALKYGVSNFKPVVLFRSKTIAESWKDYEEFLDWITTLSSTDFGFVTLISKNIAQNTEEDVFERGKSRTKQALAYMKDENITFSEVIWWIKQNFKGKNIIITNSKTNRTKTEKTDEATEYLLNSLEDKENQIRAIFTVGRLSEGWDVLNLFDIVLLYQRQNIEKSHKRISEATLKEKQLIGRGVRYFPFSFNNKPLNRRKFDHDLNHELRVLEELCYYTHDEDSRCLSYFKNELRKDGYIKETKTLKHSSLKAYFHENLQHNRTNFSSNREQDHVIEGPKIWSSLPNVFFVPYRIKGVKLIEQTTTFENQEHLKGLSLQKKFRTITKKVNDIEKHIFLKAINVKAKKPNSQFRFENLEKILKIESIDDLYVDKFASLSITFVTNKITFDDDIDNQDKLDLAIKFLEVFFKTLHNFHL